MPSTTFTSGTPVTKEWLNDVNDFVYGGGVNAMAYGTVGNGVTDDTAALQRAINAAVGGELIIPAGTYLLSDALIIPSNIKIRGMGWATHLKTGASMGNGGPGVGVRLFDLTNVTNVHISDLFLDGSFLVSLPSGHRVIHAFNSSRYTIKNCKFETSGAAVASLNCYDYWIIDNLMSISGNAGFPSHDGIIDQWYGSHDFTIRGNLIYGNGMGKYGILATATDTADQPTPMYNMSITENKIYNVSQCGIWVMGRSGVCYDFVVANNLVQNVSQFYGLAVSDSTRGTVIGNVVKNTARSGIRIYSEYNDTAVQRMILANNVFENTNTSLEASVDPGSAISVTDLSSNVIVDNNIVKGTTHRYAVFIGTNASNVSVYGNDYAKGLTGLFGVAATASNTITVPGGVAYSPTYTNRGNVTSSIGVVSPRFWREGDYVTVEGIVDIVPTASGVDTQLAISLPIASNFTVGNEATGQAVSTDGQAAACGIVDIVNDDVRIRFTSASTSSKRWMYRFRYQVK